MRHSKYASISYNESKGTFTNHKIENFYKQLVNITKIALTSFDAHSVPFSVLNEVSQSLYGPTTTSTRPPSFGVQSLCTKRKL